MQFSYQVWSCHKHVSFTLGNLWHSRGQERQMSVTHWISSPFQAITLPSSTHSVTAQRVAASFSKSRIEACMHSIEKAEFWITWRKHYTQTVVHLWAPFNSLPDVWRSGERTECVVGRQQMSESSSTSGLLDNNDDMHPSLLTPPAGLLSVSFPALPRAGRPIVWVCVGVCGAHACTCVHVWRNIRFQVCSAPNIVYYVDVFFPSYYSDMFQTR